VVEQTAWAAMTRNQKVRFVDPAQIYCAAGRTPFRETTLGIHFPSFHKNQMERFYGTAAALAQSTQSFSVRSIGMVKPRRLDFAAVITNAIRNRLS
jgi:hypothetical protein